MTYQIKQAELLCSAEQFARMIGNYIAAMNEYEEHLKGVAQDAANPALKPDERRVAFPPPECPLPGVCARRDDGKWVADYEIVGPTLAEKKAALQAQVNQREGDALESVWPVAKRRHWQFREQDIRRADMARLAAHPTRIEPKDIDAFQRAQRPEDDTAFLDAQRDRMAKVDAIQRRAARLSHDIDDLTEANVDGFEGTPLHG